MKKMIGAVITCMLVAVIIAGYCRITFILSDKTGYAQKYEYIHDDSPVDVVFIGSSQIGNAVSPVQLWNSYGMTSYNLSVPNNSLGLDSLIIKNALVYHRFKVAVIDIDGFALSEQGIEEKDALEDMVACRAMDGYPLSLTKIRTVCEYTDDPQKRADILLHFPEYHNRWKNLKDNDLKCRPEINRFRGYTPFFSDVAAEVDKHGARALPEGGTGDAKDNGYHVFKKELRDVIECCKDNNVKPVIVKIPYNASSREKKLYSSAADIADSEHVPYIDMLSERVIDPDSDYNDGGQHLNIAGAVKVTDSIGRYLHKYCSLDDHRQDAGCRSWYRTCDEYVKMLTGQLNESKGSPRSYLMVLSDKMLRSSIKCSRQERMVLNGEYGGLTDGINAEWKTDDGPENGEASITVYRTDTGQVVDTFKFSVCGGADGSRAGMEKNNGRVDGDS